MDDSFLISFTGNRLFRDATARYSNALYNTQCIVVIRNKAPSRTLPVPTKLHNDSDVEFLSNAKYIIGTYRLGVLVVCKMPHETGPLTSRSRRKGGDLPGPDTKPAALPHPSVYFGDDTKFPYGQAFLQLILCCAGDWARLSVRRVQVLHSNVNIESIIANIR